MRGALLNCFGGGRFCLRNREKSFAEAGAIEMRFPGAHDALPVRMSHLV